MTTTFTPSTRTRATRFTLLLLAFAFTATIATSPALAQREPGSLGIGAQFGEPTGFNLKFYNPGMSYDFLAAWDLDDFFYVNGHGVWERHLNQSGRAHVFFGPGAFVGFRERENEDGDDTVAGISATAGLGFLFNRFELFGQVIPRLSVTPETEGDLGGGVGVRFYF